MHNDPSLSNAAKDQISVLGDAYNTHDKATFFSKLKGSNPGAAGHCKREGVDDDGNCGHLSRNGSAIYLNASAGCQEAQSHTHAHTRTHAHNVNIYKSISMEKRLDCLLRRQLLQFFEQPLIQPCPVGEKTHARRRGGCPRRGHWFRRRQDIFPQRGSCGGRGRRGG